MWITDDILRKEDTDPVEVFILGLIDRNMVQILEIIIDYLLNFCAAEKRSFSYLLLEIINKYDIKIDKVISSNLVFSFGKIKNKIFGENFRLLENFDTLYNFKFENVVFSNINMMNIARKTPVKNISVNYKACTFNGVTIGENAVMEESNFTRCIFKNCRINFKNTSGISDTVFKDCIFSRCVFEETIFFKCTFQNVKFVRSNFYTDSHGLFQKSILIDCHIEKCFVKSGEELQKYLIRDTVFDNVSILDCNIDIYFGKVYENESTCQIASIKMTDCSITNTNIGSIHVTHSQFIDTSVYDCCFKNTTIRASIFNDVNVKKTSCDYFTMNQCHLTESNFSENKISTFDISYSSIIGCNIKNLKSFSNAEAIEIK